MFAIEIFLLNFVTHIWETPINTRSLIEQVMLTTYGLQLQFMVPVSYIWWS